MEAQIRCFTCGTVIGPRMDLYLRYQEDLYLSEQDALDKAQITRTCCRMTSMAQTQVAERVRAVGQVETVGGVMVVTPAEGASYPLATATRTPVKKAGPQVAKLAPNLGEISSTIFTSLKLGIHHLPAPTAAESVRVVRKRVEGVRIVKKEPTFGDFLDAIVDLADINTFPQNDWLTSVVKERKTLLIPAAPFSRAYLKVIIEPESTFDQVLRLLFAYVGSPSESLHVTLLKSSTIFEQPDILLQMFKARWQESFITPRQVYAGAMRVRKVSFMEREGYVFYVEAPLKPDYLVGLGDRVSTQATREERLAHISQTTIAKYANYIGNLENILVGQEIASASENLEGHFVLETGSEVVLTFERVEISTEAGEPAFEELEGSVVRSVVHSRERENVFMLVLKREGEIFVLEVLGKLEANRAGNKVLKRDYPFAPLE